MLTPLWAGWTRGDLAPLPACIYLLYGDVEERYPHPSLSLPKNAEWNFASDNREELAKMSAQTARKFGPQQGFRWTERCWLKGNCPLVPSPGKKEISTLVSLTHCSASPPPGEVSCPPLSRPHSLTTAIFRIFGPSSAMCISAYQRFPPRWIPSLWVPFATASNVKTWEHCSWVLFCSVLFFFQTPPTHYIFLCDSCSTLKTLMKDASLGEGGWAPATFCFWISSSTGEIPAAEDRTCNFKHRRSKAQQTGRTCPRSRQLQHSCISSPH